MELNKLNLYSPEYSDIKYTIHHFPDGEVHFEFDSESFELCKKRNKKYIKIVAPIRNANELFIFLQVLSLTKNMHRTITITYLMSSRNDRQMNEYRPLSLQIVCSVIAKMLTKKDDVYFITPHNMSAIVEFFNEAKSKASIYEFSPIFAVDTIFSEKSPFSYDEDEDKTLIVYPDEGAFRRFHGAIIRPAVETIAHKKRDVNTSKIIKYEVDFSKNKDKLSKIIVIDDLIDGGATFELLFKSMSDINAEKILLVTHFIQPERLKYIASLYDKVYVAETYQKIPEECSNIIVYKSFIK